MNLHLHHHFDKRRIRSHEKPENLDSTWSKHVRTAPKTLSISRLRLTGFIGQNWQVEMWNYAQNSSRFKDGSNPMISLDPKFFKAALRSTLDKIWRRCFEERIVEVCYRGLNLQMHTLFAVGPHYKNNTECFHNGLVRELKEKQRKLSRHSKTMDLIDAMTNRNVRSVRVKLIRVWTEECVSSLRVARFV